MSLNVLHNEGDPSQTWDISSKYQISRRVDLWLKGNLENNCIKPALGITYVPRIIDLFSEHSVKNIIYFIESTKEQKTESTLKISYEDLFNLL